MESCRQRLLENHVARLRCCRRCPRVIPPPVSGGAIVSDIMVIGQAPGVREPTLKRPFAHTAGKPWFGWFKNFAGLVESPIGPQTYLPAALRRFPARPRTARHPFPQTDEFP